MIRHHLLLWQNIHVHRGQSSQELATIGVGKCLLFTFIALLLLFRCIWAKRLGSSHDSIAIAIASGLICNVQKMLLNIIIIKHVIQKDIDIRIVKSFPCRTSSPPPIVAVVIVVIAAFAATATAVIAIIVAVVVIAVC